MDNSVKWRPCLPLFLTNVSLCLHDLLSNMFNLQSLPKREVSASSSSFVVNFLNLNGKLDSCKLDLKLTDFGTIEYHYLKVSHRKVLFLQGETNALED